MIGIFGNVVFNSSSFRVCTFDGLTREIQVRYAEHTVIGAKPVLEFLGNDLDAISFNMVFNSAIGVNPHAEMEKLRAVAKLGIVSTLIIGGNVYGEYVIESLSEAFDTFYNRGQLVKASVSINIKEWN